MTKDTHIAGGLAITMALAMPQGFKELAVCLTAATIGSVISVELDFSYLYVVLE